MSPVRFERNGYCMRPWDEADVATLPLHASHADIANNLRDAFPYPYTESDAWSWVKLAPTIPGVQLASEVDGVARGAIGVVLGNDIYRRSGEIGYWIAPQYWGRGIMTDAVRFISDYAFATFDIVRLVGIVFAWNPASGRVLEKAGYVKEAVLRQAVTKGGVTTDAWVYARLRGV